MSSRIAMDGMRVWIYGYRNNLAALGLEALEAPSLNTCLRLVARLTGHRQALGAPVIGYRGQRRLAGSPP
jgi:hypothetical protein